jgi:rhomboid protease GluP
LTDTDSRRTEPYSLLVEIARSADVPAVRRALDRARIPSHSGLLAGSPPRVVFYVPAARLEEARAALSGFVERERGFDPEEEQEELPGPLDAPEAQRFPWFEVRTVAMLVLVHLSLVLWTVGPWLPGRELLRFGGLIPDRVATEPWRLLTSLLLHADAPHALWNGVSMLVFAVPLLVRLGRPRTVMIYLVAGVGGGISAAGFAEPGVVIIGSSGAVAGLFGAWVVLTYRAARRVTLSRRARVRTAGIALLFLPSLLNPTTATGQPVSLSSHLGGLATGMVIGALLSSRMTLQEEGVATAPVPNRDPAVR